MIPCVVQFKSKRKKPTQANYERKEIMANISLYLWILEIMYYHMVRNGRRGGKWSDKKNACISVSNTLNGGAYTSVKQKGKKWS